VHRSLDTVAFLDEATLRHVTDYVTDK
jgi:hypothetical protein